MKQKKFFILAAAAGLLAACSSDDLTAEKIIAEQTATGEVPVLFDTYVSRGTTRAGVPGEVTTASLANSGGTHLASGFGVFAYYTDGEYYAGNTKPNFMYNQQVKSNGPTAPTAPVWTYEPIKYWPNEFGNDAISDQVDRVSFFAYAPWVSVDPLTGVVNGSGEKNTENITGMTRNNVTGDPFIKYTATMDPTNTVDLCYAVAAENFTSSNSTTFPNDIKSGEPYLNVTKPGLDGKIKFDFKHSLAKLNVQIDAVVNAAALDPTPANNTEVDGSTKIWVRSVTFEGITTKGALNLKTGEWYQIDASGDNLISSGSVTVYDGRKDGKEPVGAAANEIPAVLNPAIVQSEVYEKAQYPALKTKSELAGVTKTTVNLFKKSTSATEPTEPIYVIPTGEQFKVTIVYDVETYDKNLAYYLSDGVTLGSTIQNTITKEISTFSALEAGKAYTVKLHLGMRTVDFEASVTPWDATSVPESSVDLPSNVPTFAAIATPTDEFAESSVASIGTKEQTYTFAVKGLIPGEAVTATKTGTSVSDPVVANGVANANGIALITVTFANATNETTTTNTSDITVTGSTSNKGGTLTVNQAPHALDLKFVSCVGTALKLAMSSELKKDDLSAALTFSDVTSIKVNKVGDATDLFSAKVDDGATLSAAPESGKTYEVTVVSGDVTETITFVAP